MPNRFTTESCRSSVAQSEVAGQSARPREPDDGMAFVREHGSCSRSRLRQNFSSQVTRPSWPTSARGPCPATCMEARSRLAVASCITRTRSPLLSLPKLRASSVSRTNTSAADGEHTDHLVLPVQGEAQRRGGPPASLPALRFPDVLAQCRSSLYRYSILKPLRSGRPCTPRLIRFEVVRSFQSRN